MVLCVALCVVIMPHAQICKDDRAMRPIYGCPENFREFLATPTATFPEIFNGLLLQWITLKCVQNLKFVALPVLEIIWVPKSSAVPRYAHAPLSPKFLMGFCSDGPCQMYRPNLKSVALPVPEIAIGGIL